MAFLHCHSCGWEQDDFWDEHYNPFTCILLWKDNLLSPNRDRQFTDCAEFLRQYGPISTREWIAREFERQARKIRNMLAPTWEEWKQIKDTVICPQCGRRNWDID